jgi:hypothetical protein
LAGYIHSINLEIISWVILVILILSGIVTGLTLLFDWFQDWPNSKLVWAIVTFFLVILQGGLETIKKCFRNEYQKLPSEEKKSN